MMRSTLSLPPRKRRGRKRKTTRHPSRFSLFPQAIPAVTLPEETTGKHGRTRKKQGPLSSHQASRPAFLMPTAEASSPRAVTGRTINNRTKKGARDQATSGRNLAGHLGCTPNFSHAVIAKKGKVREKQFLPEAKNSNLSVCSIEG